jgi:exopolysaccharide biosynthesis operon protein EpsL
LRRRDLQAAIVVAGLLAPVADAAALWNDKLEVFVSETITRDDNVFRLSDASDPVTAIGSSSKGDTYTTTSPGFRFDVPVSRQRFLGELTWNDERYNEFTVLNFTGHNGRAMWKWQAGNDLSGELGYTEVLELASLSNIQGDAQSTAPNPLKTQRTFLNAAYMFTPRWRLQGELSRRQQTNEVFLENDIGINGTELTGSYITPAGNQVGLSLRVEDAEFPYPQLVNGELVDNAYSQRNVAAVLGWTPAGHSRISARAGWITRDYEQLPQRDFDGPMYRVAYDWNPTGKFTLTAILLRDISPDEQVNTSFALVKGITLYPTLRLTEKISISGALEYSDREYLGDAQLLSQGLARTDRVRMGVLTATYTPIRPVKLAMNLQRESRSSSLAFSDYEVSIISVSAGIRF